MPWSSEDNLPSVTVRSARALSQPYLSNVELNELDAPFPPRTIQHDSVLQMSAHNHEDDFPGDDVEAVYDTTDEDLLPPDPSRPATRRYLPQSLNTALQRTIEWTKGPDPPRTWKVHGFFPKIQTAPLRLLDYYAPTKKRKLWLLVLFYFVWLLVFLTAVIQSGSASGIPGYGSPTRIDCTATFFGAKNSCGMNGNQCRPFDRSELAFRCPASCAGVLVHHPRAVGTQEVFERTLVIGGPTDDDFSIDSAIYRGDSFICASAIHAGFITDAAGGCGVASLVGKGIDYPSISRNGITSFGFDSSFPISFKFLTGTLSTCADLRWQILTISVTFSVILSIFTTSAAIFFWSIFTGLYFHVALVSDPPFAGNYRELISIAIGKFLPASFVALFLYKYTIKKTLDGLDAQFEKTVLWLGACWFACLGNYTFDVMIPIQRLTPGDINAQAGGVLALVIIGIMLICIALGQAWAIRIAGEMRKYLAVYGILASCLLVMVATPSMNLRIHHYFLAMLLIPGTWVQTRPSLLYQGLLVGLFINGIARWGFDSILQTPGQLLADGQLGSDLPTVVSPIINGSSSSITFEWGIIPPPFDTVSVLVNDVERHRSFDNSTLNHYTWRREVTEHPEYFRFGYMSGTQVQDYTKAGSWNADGSWTEMAPGPSRL